MVRSRKYHLPGALGRVRLAPGVALSSDHEPSWAISLVLAAGKVHLNEHALAILELCDGSRSRERIIIDAMLRSPGALRAVDVVEFLDAARSRGWIVDSSG